MGAYGAVSWQPSYMTQQKQIFQKLNSSNLQYCKKMNVFKYFQIYQKNYSN